VIVATFAVSGSASGLGQCTRSLLEARGHRVIGVDRWDAEVVADLSADEGRRAAVGGVVEACGGVLDGFLGFAGVGSSVRPSSTIVAVNYFASVAMLDGLVDALGEGGGGVAVAVSSIAATVSPVDDTMLAAMEAGDEPRATALAGDGGVAYSTGKLALARWVRARAPEWMARGVRLNALAPGFAKTPLTDADLADPDLGPRLEAIPVPAGRWADPQDIAEVAVWLTDDASRYVVGSFLVVDGGIDALVRPTTF
jgi:NAD(P)-dependent dehydrogenase (short-subunit alcohol dehydrogenase family)